MPYNTFKTYLFNGREYYEYDEALIGRDDHTGRGSDEISAPVTKNFLFPESLLSLLYLDIRVYEPLFLSFAASLQELYRTKDIRFTDQAASQLEQLASAHIYFELFSAEWRRRLWDVQGHNFEGVQKLIPPNEIAAIPAELALMQRQIMDLFQNVLDIDRGNLPAAEKMAQHYGQAGKDASTEPFCFEAQPIGFELVSPNIFTEVLRPQTIRDLVGFHLKECVRQEVKARICKNCGKYFVIRGRTTAQYCDRIIDDSHTCKGVGAFYTWELRKRDDPLFAMYRREYKKRFAWIKAGKLEREAFYAWSKRTREKRAECEAGAITMEEFKLWLEQS